MNEWETIPEGGKNAVLAWLQAQDITQHGKLSCCPLPAYSEQGDRIEVRHALVAVRGQHSMVPHHELFVLLTWREGETWRVAPVDRHWIAALSGEQRKIIESWDLPLEAEEEE